MAEQTSNPPIMTPERHPCIDHDERFMGVMFTTNGCLACECEILAQRAAEDAATIARLTQERDERIAKRCKPIDDWSRTDNPSPPFTDEVAALARSHEALRQRAADLNDLPLCRKQVGNHGVPENTEQALQMWHDYANELFQRAAEDARRIREAEDRARVSHEDWKIVTVALAEAQAKAAEDAATIAELREVLEAREVQYQKALDILARKAQDDISRLTQERDEAVARALMSERFRCEDAGSHLDDQMTHIKRWQQAESALAALREAHVEKAMQCMADSLDRSLTLPTPPPEEPR